MSAITHGVTSCIYIEVCHYLHGSVFNIHIRDGDISKNIKVYCTCFMNQFQFHAYSMVKL